MFFFRVYVNTWIYSKWDIRHIIVIVKEESGKQRKLKSGTWRERQSRKTIVIEMQFDNWWSMGDEARQM